MIGKLLRLHGVEVAAASQVDFGRQDQDRKILMELLTHHDNVDKSMALGDDIKDENDDNFQDFSVNFNEITQLLKGGEQSMLRRASATQDEQNEDGGQ